MLKTLEPNPANSWYALDALNTEGLDLADGQAVNLQDAEGRCLGSGIFDRRDPAAAWRRFSWDPAAQFDLDYLVETLEAAVERRPEESCLRLIHSDADYLPGLTIDLYRDVLLVRTENAATHAHLDSIIEILQEGYQPREIIIRNESPILEAFGFKPEIRTQSGNPLRGFWIEIDELRYRVDPANPEKPIFPLVQREQHALVGSLCGGRRVLETYSTAGAFALQALRQGASEATVLHPDEDCIKTNGANAQRNSLNLTVEVIDPMERLNQIEAGAFEAIILDPPAACADLERLQAEAFRVLPPGGLLATYCRDASASATSFESMVAKAAAQAGREARIFAHTSQPFDFPRLLNTPASRACTGLILQVE